MGLKRKRASLSFVFADPSGFIFDVQSNTVMAQGGTFENMKEKISAVRAIVPNRSNNEIVLVLQHFDNCVDKTVQAFMEGNASEVLKEWTVTGKKKNKKKKTKPKPQAESSPGLPDPGKLVSTEEEQSANLEKGGINGFHVNGCAHDTESVDSLSEGLDALSIDARELEDCESAAPDMPDRTAVPELENGIADFDTKSLIMHPSQSPSSLRQRPEQRSASRSLSRSTASNSTPASLSVTRLEDVSVSPANKKLGSNIEKSVKDLQRCTVSLARYRVVVKEEMDASIKKMKQVFAELQSSLMDREVALLAEMDKVKAEAMEILVSRQKKAEALKKMTDVAVRMSEEQLVELRADIKHFVSERKYDEDLGRVARFTCDLDALKKSIASFGQGELDGSGGGAEVSVTPLLAPPSPKPFTCAPKLDGGETGRGLLWGRLVSSRQWTEEPALPLLLLRTLLPWQEGSVPVPFALEPWYRSHDQSLPEKAPLSLRAFGSSREPPPPRQRRSWQGPEAGGRTVWVPPARHGFWGISLPVSHPKNSYSTRLRCSSVTAASLSAPSETSAPSAPACASAASLTASKKPSSSAEAAAGNAAGRPPQPSREAFQGNRRPGAGPRSQGQRHVSPLAPGRYTSGNRHRNGPGQAHGRRQSSPLAASAGGTRQTQPTGTSGASAQPGRSGTETKGLPQRKPRASRQEGASS
ncbi:hypothetical protein QYF61_006322 [Mycteria americana]|uniref:Spermatogenesis-associated serine-rich protein 2 n=1 Tax=Mycteria americana TaxID=33587 RepID=A0AAN7N9M4_MYCAM|nr:hypothetical protein QYF61_006322 [Mycteria americana]